MLEFTIVHALSCSPERFWNLFLDPDFTREMIVDGLGFARCEPDPVVQEGSLRRRHTYVEPKVDLPGPVAKLIGPRLGYDENGTFDEKTGIWTFDMRLSVLSDRIKLGGKLRVEPAGEEQCKRIADLWVDARIMGLGKMVEKAAEKNMRDGWGKSADWMNGWMAAHPEAGKSG